MEPFLKRNLFREDMKVISLTKNNQVQLYVFSMLKNYRLRNIKKSPFNITNEFEIDQNQKQRKP